MLNNIYKKKGMKSPNKPKYRSNAFLENLNKNKHGEISNLKKEKNFVVDSGGNDQFSPNLFNYNTNRLPFPRNSNKKDLELERSLGFYQERGGDNRNMKNFTQEQFNSYKPTRNAGLSLNKTKYASPLVPSLNKNYMFDSNNQRNHHTFNNRQLERGNMHYKNSSNLKNLQFSQQMDSKNAYMSHNNKKNQFLTLKGQKEVSKKGSLMEKPEFQNFKKANTIIGCFNMKGQAKSNNFSREMLLKKNSVGEAYH